MTREESLKRLAEISEDETNLWQFINFLGSKRSLVLTYEKPKSDDTNAHWTLHAQKNANNLYVQALIDLAMKKIASFNEERNRINTSLAMGITDDEVGGDDLT